MAGPVGRFTVPLLQDQRAVTACFSGNGVRLTLPLIPPPPVSHAPSPPSLACARLQSLSRAVTTGTAGGNPAPSPENARLIPRPCPPALCQLWRPPVEFKIHFEPLGPHTRFPPPCGTGGAPCGMVTGRRPGAARGRCGSPGAGGGSLHRTALCKMTPSSVPVSGHKEQGSDRKTRLGLRFQASATSSVPSGSRQPRPRSGQGGLGPVTPGRPGSARPRQPRGGGALTFSCSRCSHAPPLPARSSAASHRACRWRLQAMAGREPSPGKTTSGKTTSGKTTGTRRALAGAGNVRCRTAHKR